MAAIFRLVMLARGRRSETYLAIVRYKVPRWRE